jgi:3-oxoadipate enol-lactonase
MPHIEIDRMRFYYQQAGSGPDVVLIHAVTSNMALWMFSGVMEALSADFRVTAYDLRGHGMTEVTPTGYTSPEMAADLAKLHKALNLKNAVLVGHSFGGVIGAHAACLYPELFDAVILSDTFFPGLSHIEPNLNQIPIWKKWCDLLKCIGADLGESLDFHKLFNTIAALSGAQMADLEKMLDPLSLRWLSGLAKLAPTTCGKDIFSAAGLSADVLCTLQKPLIALYDEHTAFSATRQFLKDNLAQCIVEDVPSANHLAPLENPNAFISLTQKHLFAWSR